MNVRPSAFSRSATAKAAGMTGAAAWTVELLWMSSSSRMCDATPFASAAPAAEDLRPEKTVASSQAPRPRTTCWAMRAGGSSEPAIADPSQSRIERFVSVIADCGRSDHRTPARKSARIREAGAMVHQDGADCPRCHPARRCRYGPTTVVDRAEHSRRTLWADHPARDLRAEYRASSGRRVAHGQYRSADPRDGPPRVLAVRRLHAVRRRDALSAAHPGRLCRLLFPAKGSSLRLRRTVGGRSELLEYFGLRGRRPCTRVASRRRWRTRLGLHARRVALAAV